MSRERRFPIQTLGATVVSIAPAIAGSVTSARASPPTHYRFANFLTHPGHEMARKTRRNIPRGRYYTPPLLLLQRTLSPPLSLYNPANLGILVNLPGQDAKQGGRQRERADSVWILPRIYKIIPSAPGMLLPSLKLEFRSTVRARRNLPALRIGDAHRRRTREDIPARAYSREDGYVEKEA